jgi:hypothetical protein
MATVTTNINAVVSRLKSNFELLLNKEYLLRPLAIETIPLMKERIHEKGQASDGSQIGTYSPEYMKVRTGDYGNSERFKKGKNAGKIKNSGTFIKKGAMFFTQQDEDTVTSRRVFIRGNFGARPNYHRSTDTKIIVSLTRQLENDWAVIATNTGYGIGFNNVFNAQKARWVEEHKSKIIFNLSAEEKQYITERLQELVNGAIGS